MIERKQLDECILASRGLSTEERRRFQMRVMTNCLQQCDLSLPLFAVQALDAASRYWRLAEGTPESLTDWRVTCWRHLQRVGSPDGLTDREASGVRAVLCVLHADDTDDEFLDEVLPWFAAFLDKLGNFKSHFGASLADEMATLADRGTH